MDDIVVAYNCQSLFRSFKDKLTDKFKSKDPRELSKVLYMGKMQTAVGGLFLSHE